MIKTPLVSRSHRLFELPHFRQVGIENTCFVAQHPSLSRLTPPWVLQTVMQRFRCNDASQQANAIRCPAKRFSVSAISIDE